MVDILFLIISAVVGYALGSVNSSVIVGKMHGVDIRTKGSGNAGLTNTLRVLGKKAAILVLAGDILKGVIAVLAGILFSGWVAGTLGAYYPVIAGTLAVIGHNWPVYFNFKGGKGILTTATVIFMVDWKIGLTVLVLFVIIVFVTRYVSLGSIIGALVVPPAALIFGHDLVFIIFMLVLAALAIFRHSANIKRLIKGNENKLSFKGKQRDGSENGTV
ncbi:MAG: glycerol-3-phosphate 1-O-acyltransferase PlsY [Clostridia bacterium]|nr:glycerol-3-phosphate 1-O-acyltransferase PlsY [Clostridia bacterium]MBN2882679.1 glycerol-3-phosphate 1-O-acyltransferase PlsY [Clostridia bacterium]